MKVEGGSYFSNSGSGRVVLSPDIIWRKSPTDVLDMECETKRNQVCSLHLTYVIILLMTSVKIVYLSVWNLFSLLSWKQVASLYCTHKN